MSRQWECMEAERLLLHEIVSREGLHHEGTIRQSRKVDQMVIEIMKQNNNGKKTGGLR
ncbi:MAG: hypothetical protein DDT21_01626 [Syntrophomonadaceae bacterium]|nr:hypothetical protein [Bacillota bacterium]